MRSQQSTAANGENGKGGPAALRFPPVQFFPPSDSNSAGVEHVKVGAARSIRRHFAGHVSRTALLTMLLPLSFASLFGALIAAAFFFPPGYDWRKCVISTLTSPYDNARGCWLPVVGIVVAMLLILPFAGYVGQRLRALSPRLAGSAGSGFALSFVLISIAVVVQLAQPVIGLRWLHEFLARAGAGSFIAGMFCCGVCALKERFRNSGQGSLSGALALSWLSLILLPIGCLASIGVLVLLGKQGGQMWAEDFRQSFRHTMLWQLAFWEWIGAGVAFAFLTISVLLLPASSGEGEFDQATLQRRLRLAETHFFGGSGGL